MDVVLVLPAAVDVDAPERLQIVSEALHHVDRVLLEPRPPAGRQHFAGLEVDRQSKAQRRLRVGVVARGHGHHHQGVDFGAGQFFLGPDRLQEARYAAVIVTVQRPLFLLEHIDRAFLAFFRAVPGKLVQDIGPVAAVQEVEVGVAGVVGDGAPVPGVLHAVHHGAVAAGRLAEAAAVIAGRQGAELLVHERNQLRGQIVGVLAHGRGIDVLVAPERREAVGKHQDARPHLVFVDQSSGPIGHVLRKVSPVGMGLAGAGVAHQVEEHGEALALAGGLFVSGRQPDVERPDVGISQRVVLEDPGAVLQGDDLAGRPVDTFARHGSAGAVWGRAGHRSAGNGCAGGRTPA